MVLSRHMAHRYTQQPKNKSTAKVLSSIEKLYIACASTFVCVLLPALDLLDSVEIFW